MLKINNKEINTQNQPTKTTATTTWMDNAFRLYHTVISCRREKNPGMVHFSFLLILFKVLGNSQMDETSKT